MGVGPAARNQSADGLRAYLRRAATAALREADAPGAAVALIADGRTVLAAGVGHRDLGRSRPLGAGGRFYAYSITKVFLAVAALRLAEQRRLALDDPIRSVLPDVPLAEPVTIRRLLNHTAGLPDYGAMPRYGRDLRADPGAPWTADEFIKRTLRHGPRFPLGRGWAYSNVGFLLVRRAIEQVTRCPLREALADLVFGPAGLRRTAVSESLDDAVRLTPGYSTHLDDDGRLRDATRRYHPGWVSHGVAVTTAPELARALEALFGGRLLEPGSLAAMLEAVPAPVPAEHPPFARPGYGLGLMVDLGSPYGRVAGHAGGGPGYSAAVFHFPDVAGRRLTSVAVANRDGSDFGTRIAFALVAAYVDRLDPRPPGRSGGRRAPSA